MPDEFDPYLAWLGIPTTSRPPSYYQLLGLPEFEKDEARIGAAADARMGEVRKYQTGPRGKFTQKLLNELAGARVCLLDAQAKASYDAKLHEQRAVMHWSGPPVAAYPAMNAPPLVEPPALPPPVAKRAAAKLQVSSGTADDEPGVSAALSPWWPLLGIFFVALIVGSCLTVYLVSQRQQITNPPKSQVENSSQVQAPAPAADDGLVIAQEGNGDLSFPASTAELSGGLMRSEVAGESVISGWKDDTTVARWRFRTIRPAVFQVRITYQAHRAGSGRWQMGIGDDVKARDLQNSAANEEIVVDEFFWRIRQGGEQTFQLSTDGLTDESNVTLKSVRFIYQAGGRLQ